MSPIPVCLCLQMVKELSRAWRGLAACTVHVGQHQDLFCSRCDVALCAKCALTSHRRHDIISVDKAAPKARISLEASRPWLESAVNDLKSKVSRQ
jgi:hypothetical protein